MSGKQPRKPERLNPIAQKVLAKLAGRPESAEIVLGGFFALQHFVSYRETHDIDAWWRTRAAPNTESAIREVMAEVAAEEKMELRERRFGETLSFELFRNQKKEFSFQIAVRSVELEPPLPSAWPPIQIETLADNVGAKMNALVERGAPRDFRDIHRVVTAGLIQPSECWFLWSRKNPGQPVTAARDKVRLHLSGITSRRPLESIKNVAERQEAQQTRNWFIGEFLKD